MRSNVKTLSIDPLFHSIGNDNSNRLIIAIEIIANIHGAATDLTVKQHASWASAGPEYQVDSGSTPYCITTDSGKS